MGIHTCHLGYHEALRRNQFFWRLKTEHIGFEVDTAQTVELGTCTWCGRVIERVVWEAD